MNVRFTKLASLGLLCAACASETPVEVGQLGTETNWLKGCESDAECGDFTCECGICTDPCETDAECTVSGAECRASYGPEANALCATASVESAGLCLPPCSASCDANEICLGDRCEAHTALVDVSIPSIDGSLGGMAAPNSSTLEDGAVPEPDCTPSTCPCVETWRGDFHVAGPDDLPALGCVKEISGSLSFDQICGIGDLELPNLERVGGDASFYQTDLTSVNLPALETVGGFVRVHENGWLQQVALPALATTGDYVGFTSNCSLLGVELGALTSIGAPHTLETGMSFLFLLNGSIQSLDVPSLESVEGMIAVAQNCSMETLSFSSLQHVGAGSVYVQDNTSMDTESLGALSAHLDAIEFAGTKTLGVGFYCEVSDGCVEPSCAAPLPTD